MPWPPPSTLPDAPFPSRTLAAVAAVAEALLTPAYWALDRLLALLVPTTAQRARWRRHRAGLCLAVGARALLAPVLVLALALALPPALLGLLLWLPAQAKRRPFVHQHTAGTAAAAPWDPRRARGFTFLTGNVCLLPSGLARFSNLGETRRRAALIGQALAAGAPAEPAGHRRGLLGPRRGRGYGGTAARGRPGGDARGDAGRVAGPAETVGGTMGRAEMAMGNPTSTGNSMSMGNPTPMANSTWMNNPTPMTDSTWMTNPTPMTDSTWMTNPTPMTNSTWVTNPTRMTNPTAMTNSTRVTNPTFVDNSSPMTNSTWMTNPTPMTSSTRMTSSRLMANPTPMTNSALMTDSTWTTNPTPMTNPTLMTNPTPMTNPSLGAAPCPTSSPGPERPIPLADPMPPVLSAHIPPDVDFVCLQEVFDGAAAAALRRQLGRRFPHVLWGVGPGGLRGGRLRALGSGLLLGSRFPPLAARFLPFPNAAREDALANKGLLVVQVLLGMGRGRRVVGYLGCTHLQAPAADATIRDQQLSWVLRWLREFRHEQHRPGDLVAFDVLCGDLNFDNCSRGDSQNRRHALFKEFWDPACCDSGQEQPWAIGTLLNYLRIYEEPVSTPEEMRRTLSEPWGRERFLAGPILSCGALDPMAARPWQGRRVDRALLRRGPTLTTEVTGYSVITELATMSDHLPVALRLRLGPADL